MLVARRPVCLLALAQRRCILGHIPHRLFFRLGASVFFLSAFHFRDSLARSYSNNHTSADFQLGGGKGSRTEVSFHPNAMCAGRPDRTF
jgi:hypothetical protein